MKQSLFVAALLALALSGCPDNKSGQNDEASAGAEASVLVEEASGVVEESASEPIIEEAASEPVVPAEDASVEASAEEASVAQ